MGHFWRSARFCPAGRRLDKIIAAPFSAVSNQQSAVSEVAAEKTLVLGSAKKVVIGHCVVAQCSAALQLDLVSRNKRQAYNNNRNSNIDSKGNGNGSGKGAFFERVKFLQAQQIMQIVSLGLRRLRESLASQLLNKQSTKPLIDFHGRASETNFASRRLRARREAGERVFAPRRVKLSRQKV